MVFNNVMLCFGLVLICLNHENINLNCWLYFQDAKSVIGPKNFVLIAGLTYFYTAILSLEAWNFTRSFLGLDSYHHECRLKLLLVIMKRTYKDLQEHLGNCAPFFFYYHIHFLTRNRGKNLWRKCSRVCRFESLLECMGSPYQIKKNNCIYYEIMLF